VQLVEAFDARTERDNDPDVTFPALPTERPVLGTTVSRTATGSEPVCAVFRETVRDSVTRGFPLPASPLPQTVAHEVLCHALGNVGSHATPAEELAVFFTLCRLYEAGIAEGWDDMSEQQRAKLRRLSVPQARRIQ